MYRYMCIYKQQKIQAYNELFLLCLSCHTQTLYIHKKIIMYKTTSCLVTCKQRLIHTLSSPQRILLKNMYIS